MNRYILKKILFYFSLFFVFFSAFQTHLKAAAFDESLLQKFEKKPFKDLFDKSLYDLKTLNHYDIDKDGNTAYKEDFFGDLAYKKDRLEKRKINALEKHVISRINGYKTQLTAHTAHDKKKLFGKALEALTTMIISTLVTSLSGKATITESLAIGLITGLLKMGVDLTIEIFFNPALCDNLKKISILTERLYKSIENEPIKKLENRLLELKYESIKKPFEDKIDAIEAALIQTRRIDYDKTVFDYDAYLNKIFELPDDSLLVPKTEFLIEGAQGFRTIRDAFLDGLFPSLATGIEPGLSDIPVLDSCRYKRETRIKLKEAIRLISNRSWLASQGKVNKGKRGVIFYGQPGTGKTKAAHLMAQACKLPYYDLLIRQKSDIEASSLYGVWHNFIINKNKVNKSGILVDAFFAENSSGERAKNLILILDDVDLGFIDNIQGIIGFLKDLVDDQVRKKMARYYGFDVDFGEVFVIATMNMDIRDNPDFARIESIYEFVDFGALEDQTVKLNVMQMIDDDYLSLSSFFGDREESWPQIKSLLADFLVQLKERDFRMLESYYKILVNYPVAEWNHVARLNGWEKII